MTSQTVGRFVILLAVTLTAGGRSVRAQVSGEAGAAVRASAAHAVDATTRSAMLLDEARQAIAVYADRSTAIAAGYRLVGRDFPSMGEHWLNPRLIIEGAFDVARPSILTYVTVGGHPMLTGAVYAIPLAPGESPPDAFGPAAMWHEHNGTIEEEGLLTQHHTTPSAATGTRVAILHTWTRLPNPGGVFSADNWAIPFVRLGLGVPAGFSDNAAKAASLLSGSGEYFLAIVSATSQQMVESELEACRSSVEKTVATAKAEGRELTPEDITELDARWASMLASMSRRDAEAARLMNGGEPVASPDGNHDHHQH